MTSPHLDLCWLERVDQALREAALRGEFRTSYLRQALYDVGFVKFRYYEYSSSNITNHAYYVLRELGPDMPAIPPELHVWPSLDVHQFELEAALRPRRYIGGEQTLPKNLKDFHKLIDAVGLPCVFVPIHAGNELIAKFGLSWNGYIEELSEEDLSSLVILSRLCGRYIRLAQDVNISRASNQIDEINFSSERDGFRDGHRKFLNLLEQLCPYRIGSIFEHNWANDSVTKIVEYRRPPTPTGEFSESYFRGHHLTGFAFTQTESFLITQIVDLADSRYPSLQEDSLKHHEEIIPGPLSVIFSKFESGHREFVVRLFARATGPSPHFSNLELNLVARLCKKFAHKSNDFAAQRNLEIIQEIFRLSISDFSRYDNVINRFSEIYSRVFPQPLVLIAKHRDSSGIDYNYSTDRAFSLRASKIDPGAIAKISASVSKHGVQVIDAKRFNSMLGASCVDEDEATHAFVLPMLDADLEGILFTPVRSLNSDSDIQSGLKSKTKQTLLIISAIISSAISASSQHITTENAKRLIGHIGHETETPIANLSNAAEYALMRARDAIETLGIGSEGALVEVGTIIDEQVKEIREESRNIKLLIEMAIDMAQETESRIDVTYRRFDLSHMLRDLAELVSDEVIRYQRPGVRVFFNFNKRAEALREFVGDKSLIEKIFLNLFRNAAKYSYTRGQGQQVIDIRVNAAIQQSIVDLEITNWGVPVKQTEFEKIFMPFVRGEAMDPVSGRKGMGLGLYIARRFAQAHGGSVWCRASEPTLDDPLRRDREGHQVTFVVRLPTNLTAATARVQLK